jgi:hypothetical protein
MEFSAPKRLVWWISVFIFIFGVMGVVVEGILDVLGPFLLVVAYVVLAFATLLKPRERGE